MLAVDVSGACDGQHSASSVARGGPSSTSVQVFVPEGHFHFVVGVRDARAGPSAGDHVLSSLGVRVLLVRIFLYPPLEVRFPNCRCIIYLYYSVTVRYGMVMVMYVFYDIVIIFKRERLCAKHTSAECIDDCILIVNHNYIIDYKL